MFGSTIIKYLRFSGDFGQVDKSVKHELESALRVHRLLLLKGNGYCLLSIAIFDDREMFSRLFTYIKSFQLRCFSAVQQLIDFKRLRSSRGPSVIDGPFI